MSAIPFTSPSHLQLEGLSACGPFLALSSSALGGNDWSGELRVFDGRIHLDVFKTLGAVKLPCGSSSNVMFDNGTKVCCAGDDGNVYLFKVSAETGLDQTPVIRFADHDDIVSSVHVNPVNSALASASWDKTTKLWDVETGKLLQTIPVEDQIVSAQFLTNTTVVTAEHDGSISVWDTRQVYEMIARKKLDRPVCSMINFGEAQLIIGCDNGVVEYTPHPEFYQEIRDHHAAVHALAVCSETERLLSGSDDGRVYGAGNVHTDFVRGAAFWKGRPVTSSWDGTLRFVNINDA
jgi:WD40 repeat protein